MHVIEIVVFFYFKHKTAYERRISDWSSDVCSSDLPCPPTDAASLTASALNSCVYCRLGSLPSFISILRTSDVINFLLYVKSRQGQVWVGRFESALFLPENP